MNLSEKEMCGICEDTKRNHAIITVIESPLDLLSFEKGGIYHGVYHVLHGRIDPLNNIGPDDIFIEQLVQRVGKEKDTLQEIVLATNPDMEGEATAMYIQKRIQALTKGQSSSGRQSEKLNITRLAYGLPMGASVEYADYGTLGKAMENRKSF